MRISAEKFVKEWQKAPSLDILATKLKTTKAHVSARAVNYRKKGVPLKKFHGTKGTRIDVAGLTKVAKANGPLGANKPRKTSAAKKVKAKRK